MEIFIHIGPHKTGTTTIQHGLGLNEKVLRRNGVLVPNSGRPFPKNGGVHNLAWELVEYKSKSYHPEYGSWKDLLNELKESKEFRKAVLSSEGFCFLDVARIQKVCDWLEDYQVKIIIYVRRQDEAIQSFWVECAKNFAASPQVGSFYEWVEEYNYYISRYDYSDLISKWEAVFSQENIILRLFKPDDFKPSLFHDFLSLCDIKVDHIFLPKHTNISPGVKIIEAIRLVKNHIDFSHLDERKWNYIFKGLKNQIAAWEWDEKKVNYLDEELSLNIMARYEKGNHQVAQKYFQRENLFKEKTGKQGPVSRFTYEDFSKLEVMRIFAVVTNLLTNHGRYGKPIT